MNLRAMRHLKILMKNDQLKNPKNFIKSFLSFVRRKSIAAYFGFLRLRYGRAGIVRRRINDYNIYVFNNNEIGRQIILKKKYEEENSQALKKLIKKNWICLDIGANIGYYSLLLASLAPMGKVYSFEPIRSDYGLININADINDFRHIKTLNIAVSDSDGQADFSVSKDSAFSSLFHTGRNEEIKKIKTPTAKLDSLVKELNIDKINFIKIDVEGSERLVIAGGADTLKNLKPDVILVEVCEENLAAFKVRPADLIDSILAFDYSPYICSEGRFKPFDYEMLGFSTDIFFFRYPISEI